jgi:hypothetical protein
MNTWTNLSATETGCLVAIILSLVAMIVIAGLRVREIKRQTERKIGELRSETQPKGDKSR